MKSKSVFWTKEKKDRATKLLLKGYTYSKVASLLNLEYPNETFNAEKVRGLKRKGKLGINPNKNLSDTVTEHNEDLKANIDSFHEDIEDYRKQGKNFEVVGNYAILDYRGEKNPQTLDELLDACNVDTEIWKVDRYVVNKWETAMKTSEAIIHRPLFQVKAWLVRIKPVEVEFPHITPIAPINFKKPKINIKKSKNFKKALIIPDAQFGFRRHVETGVLDPFHDRQALDCVLQVAELEKPDTIIYLGDMMDLPEWSDKF